jgi:(p)ppGpp synthase/HD superfamily hydrolase
MENLVDKAVALALKAHTGQLDKGGNPYILHPLRMALRFNDPSLQVISILHDVIEDSNITFSDLNSFGFSNEIVEAISALTKNESENYEDFINRVCLNKLATQVKLVDLEDNMDVTRIKNLTEEDRVRLNKYKKAYDQLKKIIGNSENETRP